MRKRMWAYEKKTEGRGNTWPWKNVWKEGERRNWIRVNECQWKETNWGWKYIYDKRRARWVSKGAWGMKLWLSEWVSEWNMLQASLQSYVEAKEMGDEEPSEGRKEGGRKVMKKVVWRKMKWERGEKYIYEMKYKGRDMTEGGRKIRRRNER